MTPEEFLLELESSTRLHGPEHTLSLIADDAVYWFSDGSSHVGKAAVERAFLANFETIQDDDYHMQDVVWIAKTEEFAACIFRFEWSGIVRGKPASGSGRGTLVLARCGDSWVVKHEHLSP